jgi:hypothetical protein
MTLNEMKMFSRAFAGNPAAMAQFLANLRAAGIAVPTGDDDDGMAVDSRPKEQRYDGTPGDSDGKNSRWRGDDAPPKSPGGPMFRTKEARERFKNTSAMPMGPQYEMDESGRRVLRFYASCLTGRR